MKFGVIEKWTDMEKVDKKLLYALGAGVGAAVIATLLFVTIESFRKPQKVPKYERTVEIRVLKALKEIPEGTIPAPEMLGYTTVPVRKATPDTLVDPVQVSNLKTVHTLTEGSVLTKGDFQSFTPTAIPEGFVAMSLQIDTVSGITWMLKPEDIVDIIGVLRPVAPGDKRGQVSTVLLQAVRVLAVEAPVVKKDKKVNVRDKGTVTLLMTPEQAQKLMLLSTAGQYTMALRGGGDDAEREILPTSIAEITAPPKAAAPKPIRPRTNRLVVVEVK